MNVTYSNFTEVQQMKLDKVREVGQRCMADPCDPKIPTLFDEIKKLEADLFDFCKYLAKGKERKNG